LSLRSADLQRGFESRSSTAALLAPALLVLTAGAVPGCAAAAVSESALISPDAIGNDMGTRISSADIRDAASRMMQSMHRSGQLARMRRETRPLRVLVGSIRQFTTITNFDKQLFQNRLLAGLTAADLDGDFLFLERSAVAPERRLQSAGAAGDIEPPLLAGAQLILSGEVRELLTREPTGGGGELEKRTIQYALRLADVRDGAIVWSDAHEVVKEQVIGAVYR
jgi:hypothetical protein